MKIIAQTGNEELLKLKKVAFLCSRQIPSEAVLKCYDWAIAQREAGKCVISGFHSKIEKDVFHYLLKGKQPIILALARGMKKRIEPELQKPLKEGRLLIISPFAESVTHVTEETAAVRNRLMVEMAEEVVVGYVKVGGGLEKVVEHVNEKKVLFLVGSKKFPNKLKKI